MLESFRTYQLAVRLHGECKKLKLPGYLRLQLLRASSSICLNLAEGTSRPSRKEKQRFYAIAFGSLREVQAIMDLERGIPREGLDLIDHLGACLYRLTFPSN
ncbi:MAG: four helix bundle protein [Pseudomonadota bacterium]